MTAPATLSDWIAQREPPVPEAFRPWVRPAAADAPPTPAAWVAEARRALARMDGDPTTRRAAFELLAADGFATWAAEMALDAADPARALRGVLDALME